MNILPSHRLLFILCAALAWIAIVATAIPLGQ
jgi:hypothetical protein